MRAPSGGAAIVCSGVARPVLRSEHAIVAAFVETLARAEMHRT
jgi:hypothetical protein